jgi:hypothetical protein
MKPALYPSTSAWDVPALRLDVQPTRVLSPVLQWGSVARTRHMPGTWSLYVDDHRFSANAIAPRVTGSRGAVLEAIRELRAEGRLSQPGGEGSSFRVVL